MPKLELFFYVSAAIILIVIGVNTSFSHDFVNLVGSVSGVVVLLGIVFAALALLWRRVKIRRKRTAYGDKAESVERSVNETLIEVAKGFVLLWFLLIIGGTLATIKQYL